MRLLVLMVCFALGILPAVTQSPTVAQPPPSAVPQAFPISTIKSSQRMDVPLVRFRGNKFVTDGTTFLDLFKYAFNVHPDQLVGGPSWLKTQRFDVVGDPQTESRPSSDQMKALVRQLLIDRFGLVTHHETRILAVYELHRFAGAPKLQLTTHSQNGIPGVAYNPAGQLDVVNASMADVAIFLQRFVLDRPTLDGTGLPGKYDFVLKWAPDTAQIGNPVVDADQERWPSLFSAIKEQLGLRVVPTRASVDVIVVDKVEQPSPN